MVVHEWLYYYIYNDVLRFSLGKLNKHHAKVTVFLVSIVVHELIVTYLLKFFYPVLSLFFGGPGIIFTYIKTKDKKFNVIFWFKLYLGIGLIFALLLREFKARELFVGVELISQVHYITPKSYLIYLDYYSDLLK